MTAFDARTSRSTTARAPRPGADPTLGARVPDERWAVLLAVVAADVARILVRRTADLEVLAREVERFLLEQAELPALAVRSRPK